MASTVEWNPGDRPTTLVRFGDQALAYEQSDDFSYYDSLKRMLNSRFDLTEAHHRPVFERFYRFEKLIQMVAKRKYQTWKANAFLPYALSISEQAAAIKWLALFLTRPFVTVEARRAGLEDNAIRRQSLLDWHFTGDMNLLDVTPDMFRQCERYGKSIARVSPRWDPRTRNYREKRTLSTASGPVARYGWKSDQSSAYGIDLEVMDLTDFFGQPNKNRINGRGGMDWCFDQSWATMDELIEAQANGDFGPDVGGQSVETVRDTKQQEIGDYKLRRLFMSQTDDTDKYRDPYDQIIHLLTYQGRVPRTLIDPKKAEMEDRDGRDPYQRLIVLANRDSIIEDVAMPWDHGMKSYVEMDSIREPYSFWGKGKIEPNEHLIYAGNEIVNLRLDNVKMNVNGLIGVDETQMPPGWRKHLISQPFGVIPTRGNPNNVIQRLQLGDVTSSSYQEQQQIYTLIQEGSAVNETMIGAPGERVKTLGEHELKLESASKRLQFELVAQAKQLLGWPGGLSSFAIQLDRQYLPIETYIRVINPDSPDEFTSFTINPEDLQDEDEMFAYYATGATEGINAQARRSDLAMMLEALQPFGEFLAQTGFNFQELVKVIVKTFGHDPGRFFPKGSEMMAGAGGDPQQALAAVQAAMGQGGGMPPGAQPPATDQMGVPMMPGMPGGPSNGPPVAAGPSVLNPAIMQIVRGMSQ